MQPKSIYISSAQPRAGSLIIAIGIMEMLKGRYKRVAFFRPIIPDATKRESDIEFMLEHFNLDMNYDECCGFTIHEYIEAYAQERDEVLCNQLMEKIIDLEKRHDFVLIEGYHRSVFSSALEFDINMKIAKNIGTIFLPILNAKEKSKDEIINEMEIIDEMIRDEGLSHLATIVNRCDENILSYIKEHISSREHLAFVLPEVKKLDTPTIREVKESLKADMIMGSDEQLEHLVLGKKIAAMGIENYLDRIGNGSLVIVPGDRVDIIFASLLSHHAKGHPNIAGIILSGGFQPDEHIIKLIEDFGDIVIPILCFDGDSYQAAIALDMVEATLTPNSIGKITLAKGIFDEHIDKEAIAKRFRESKSDILTPMMFEYRIFDKARSNRQKIVLPESGDDRILRATEILLRRGIVDVVLLGDSEKIYHQSSLLGLDISQADIINPERSHLREEFSQKFYEMRKAKGLTIKVARDAMTNSNYFATMMVQEGLADGMVSGAAHTTSDTIRPALQIIKTKPNISIVSSIFFMTLETEVLIYGDCAINLDPDYRELAQIAISSADTAMQFGIEPVVALLSYSTGDSGSGPDVEKVRKATKLAQSLRPDLLIEGPIQYDAAIDESVAKKKLPHSKVAGRATIFIFPDLNTGNNTYKAVQRSTGISAIGPVLQGLRLPVNDLSRGCLVADIVNTVAITAIQAQQNGGK
ncbi:Phosphate acetyltransferase [hydrothermal vent metagenome]|uniref:Phosphate acetyltransferase n=1 Tax=hydrothermal vent metagenome TaxID=652676 RepID=A0A1W1BK32_9ZZZZ